ncbi:MAG: hypothetical protein QNJ63_29095 [Calothrix sp. MO_192.B10]|nr:hypothetical protein [Calothrix sp. MO_192.B10]
MKSEYDFSNAERGKFYRQNTKFNVPIYLDEDVLDYFTERAEAKGVNLNDMINDLLKRDIALVEGVK